MICPNCNKETNEAGVCPHCSAVVSSALSVKEKLSQKDFLKTAASNETKQLYKCSKIAVIFCVAAMIVGFCFSIFSSLYDLPVTELVLGNEGIAELERNHSYAAYNLETAEDITTEFAAVLDPKNPHHAEEILEDAKSFIELPSLYNINNFLSHYEDETLTASFSTLMTVMFLAVLVIVLMTVAAFYFKKTVFVIVSLVLACLYTAVFASQPFVPVVLVGYIALAFTMAKVNHDYRTYKRS